MDTNIERKIDCKQSNYCDYNYRKQHGRLYLMLKEEILAVKTNPDFIHYLRRNSFVHSLRRDSLAHLVQYAVHIRLAENYRGVSAWDKTDEVLYTLAH